MMETGAFIIARWLLTFGIVLAFGLYQIRQVNDLQKARAQKQA